MASGVSALTEGCFNKNRSAGWVLCDILEETSCGLGRGKDDTTWAVSMDLRRDSLAALRGTQRYCSRGGRPSTGS